MALEKFTCRWCSGLATCKSQEGDIMIMRCMSCDRRWKLMYCSYDLFHIIDLRISHKCAHCGVWKCRECRLCFSCLLKKE